MTTPVTMFSTTWCGYCRRLKSQLEAAGVPYREIDVEDHPTYGERIEAVTGGYRIVPTVEIGDRLLVNPSLAEVTAALEGLV